MSTALDVAIGMILLYLLLALLVVTVQELIASVFNLRAKHLYASIEGMLKSGALKSNANSAGSEPRSAPLSEQLYRHPLLKNLVDEQLEMIAGKIPTFGGGLPSYIPSKTFALALLDVLQGGQAGKVTGAANVLASAKGAVLNLEDGELKDALTLLLDDVEQLEQDIDKRALLASERIEGWFNDRMARASGWYKRKAQYWSFVIAIGVTIAFNADSLHVAERLWSDAGLRAAVAAGAQSFHEQHAGMLLNSRLPIGWQEWTGQKYGFPLISLGWLITALGVSLGAPFWFDVLSKAVQIRSSGAKVSPTTGEVEGK